MKSVVVTANATVCLLSKLFLFRTTYRIKPHQSIQLHSFACGPCVPWSVEGLGSRHVFGLNIARNHISNLVLPGPWAGVKLSLIIIYAEHTILDLYMPNFIPTLASNPPPDVQLRLKEPPISLPNYHALVSLPQLHSSSRCWPGESRTRWYSSCGRPRYIRIRLPWFIQMSSTQLCTPSQSGKGQNRVRTSVADHSPWQIFQGPTHSESRVCFAQGWN